MQNLKDLDLDKNLDRINEAIRSADQKVAVLLGFQGVLLTLIFPNATTLLSQTSNPFAIVTSILGLILLLAGITKSLMAIIPRLNNKAGNLTFSYFGSIAQRSFENFSEKVEALSYENYRKNLIREIYDVSKIALAKYTNFRQSVIFFSIGMILLLAAYSFSLLR